MNSASVVKIDVVGMNQLEFYQESSVSLLPIVISFIEDRVPTRLELLQET